LNPSTKEDEPEFVPIPRTSGGPLFSEPWEAQAFAIAFKLIEDGHFTRSEWAKSLGRAIQAAQAQGDPDQGNTYYYHVLAAIESLISEKELTDQGELETRKQAWQEAYLSTPHGKPVVLKR